MAGPVVDGEDRDGARRLVGRKQEIIVRAYCDITRRDAPGWHILQQGQLAAGPVDRIDGNGAAAAQRNEQEAAVMIDLDLRAAAAPRRSIQVAVALLDQSQLALVNGKNADLVVVLPIHIQ